MRWKRRRTSTSTSQAPHFFTLPGCSNTFGRLSRGRRPSRSFARTRRGIWTMFIDSPEDGSPKSTPHARRPDACSASPKGLYGRHLNLSEVSEGVRPARVMVKPRPEKKPAAPAPPTRVLPMQLRIGDRVASHRAAPYDGSRQDRSCSRRVREAAGRDGYPQL